MLLWPKKKEFRGLPSLSVAGVVEVVGAEAGEAA